MSTIAKPPCDAGVILSAPHTTLAVTRPNLGPWVLTATILGSSMVFIDSVVVNVALPALQANHGL